MSEKTTSSRRSSSSSDVPENATTKAIEAFGGEPVTDYDEALEVGYWGGPVDPADHTVAGEIAAAAAAKKEARD